MNRVLFLFLDGVGLGSNDPAINPLAADRYPTLAHLLDGHPPTLATGRLSTTQAELIPTDAKMGVPGRPQSATGQAAILTGINAPQRLGEHYGPRPDDRVRAVIDEGNLFRRLQTAGLHTHFCNAYPQRYFDSISSGKRLLSAIPYAATTAGLRLHTHADLMAGRALAADFTNQFWRSELGYLDAPLHTPQEAGQLFWQMAQPYHFVFFEHWQTDLLGHNQDLAGAIRNFEVFDSFLAGLLAAADLEQTLIIVASDHGNVENCSHGKHTENPALTLVLGAQREKVARPINSLFDYANIISDWLLGEWPLP